MKKIYTLLISIMSVGSILCAVQVNAQQPQLPLTASEYNPILSKGEAGTWDSDLVFDSYVVYDEEEDFYYMFYCGGDDVASTLFAIGFATSHDGIFFTKYEQAVFMADNTGFDSYSIADPAIIKSDDEWIMFYSAKETLMPYGPGKGIGRATAPDPQGPWTRLDDPVLESGIWGDWDCSMIAPSCVLEVDSGLLLYYWGSNEDGAAGPWQVGMAFSDDDGYSWEKYDDPSTKLFPFSESDPVIPIGEQGQWDADAISSAGIIKTDDQFQAFYGAVGFDGCGIGYATSDDGIHWDKQSNNPQYVIADDPYAVNMNYSVMELPSVILNAEKTHYYIYYDWGPSPQSGEIGMATAENLAVGIPDHNEAEMFNCSIYPNPCSSTTKIRYRMPDAGYPMIDLFTIEGRKIRELVNPELMPGEHEINIDVSELPAGVYFVRLQAGNEIAVRKLVVSD